MLKTNKLRFFKILGKASKPLKTLKWVKKRLDEYSYLILEEVMLLEKKYYVLRKDY